MDNVSKFDGKAGSYSLGRPSYPEELIDFICGQLNLTDGERIADIGSGTGIFTEQLLNRGIAVYAVEPNADMRSVAESRLGANRNFISIDGCAENTRLADASADIVVAAQAFHWFDGKLFKKECDRILRSGGIKFLIWNMRDMGATVNLRIQEVCRRYCPSFNGFSGGTVKNDGRIVRFFDGNFRIKEYENPDRYSKEKFISRCLSSSYSIDESNNDYKAYIDALTDIFEEFSKDGELIVANKTVAYYG